MSEQQDGIKVKGAYRLQIAENGEIVGDSGWYENVIVNQGFLKYLVSSLGGIAGSTPTIEYMAVGVGGAPAATDTSLASEVSKRAAVTAATSAGSKAVIFTATFASSASFVTAAKNLSNVGLFALSAAGTMFSGNTYASSAVNTNQDVYATYSVTFS